MKKTYVLASLLCSAMLGVISCNDTNEEFEEKGKCSIVHFQGPEQAYMGDSITFQFEVSGGGDVDLNQSKLQLYYGDKIVSERIIVTPKSGEYTGKLLVPFIKNMGDSEVNLKLRLQNTRFTNVVSEKKIVVMRPQFPKLILRDNNGQTYDMLPSKDNPYEYSVTDYFPSELYATIEAPKYGENGNDIVFGSSDGKITNGTSFPINFTADIDGIYTVTFNTLTFEGAPFVKFAMNDIEFTKVDELHFKIETELKQGQDIQITGLKADYENYWVNPAFFRKVKGTEGRTLRFMGRDGLYRLTVDKNVKYFRVEVMNAAGTDIADLRNGDDVIWCIGGGGIGQPSYGSNPVNWTPGDKVICLAPIGNGKHQLVLEPGVTINKYDVNFKFFFQRNWGEEFKSARLTMLSGFDWFRINPGPNDDGNIMGTGTLLKDGYYYVLTVDMSEGYDKSKFSVEEVQGFDEVDPLEIK